MASENGTPSALSPSDVVRILYPGQKVELAGGVVAHVYPAGKVHLGEFARELAVFAGAIDRMGKAGEDGPQADRAAAMLKAMGPAAVDSLLNLLQRCTRFDGAPEGVQLPLGELPLEVTAKILEAFIEQNDVRNIARPLMGVLAKVRTAMGDPSTPAASTSGTPSLSAPRQG